MRAVAVMERVVNQASTTAVAEGKVRHTNCSGAGSREVWLLARSMSVEVYAQITNPYAG
jgi:hypothetical protein